MLSMLLSACGSDGGIQEVTAPTISKSQYTLFTPLASKDTYLVNEDGDTVHTWSSNYRPGLSTYLLENGELLHTGSNGVIEILDWESNVIWTQTISAQNDDIQYQAHHDVSVLPNGNILALVQETISADEAEALGRITLSEDTLKADAVYEICRSSESNDCTDGEIVWQWSVWDHIVQDTDSSISATYVTDVSEHTDKIDINYYHRDKSDWTHGNGIDYNVDTDQIIISLRNFSEYWVLDHSDASSGIVYRNGNPAAYGGAGERTLYFQHDAHWIAEGTPGAGNILIFNNGLDRPEGNYSSVDEYCDSDDCEQGALIKNYSEGVSGEFYADHISGSQRLSNGHTLVCEGTEGRLFEYDENDNIVWELEYGASIFRAYRYDEDYTGLSRLAE